MNYCENCGNKIEQEQNFCPKCGMVLKKENKNIKKSNQIFILNSLKYLFYLASFILFFFIITLVISKINGECYENYCENNLIMFISAFICCLLIAIICSVKTNKIKEN